MSGINFSFVEAFKIWMLFYRELYLFQLSKYKSKMNAFIWASDIPFNSVDEKHLKMNAFMWVSGIIIHFANKRAF